MQSAPFQRPHSEPSRRVGWSTLHKSRVALLIFLSMQATFCFAQDPQAFVAAGNAKFKANDLDGAVADYSKALAINPKLANAWKFRGLTKSMKGDWNGCLTDLNAAVAIEPRNQDFLATRAFAYVQLGRFTNANADFAALQRLDPRNGPKAKLEIAQGLISRARGKSAGRDKEGAIRDLDMVIGLFPNMGVAYHERGAARLELKHYKEAVADFDRAVKDKAWQTGYADSHLLRAKAKRAMGDIAGANADERAARKR